MTITARFRDVKKKIKRLTDGHMTRLGTNTEGVLSTKPRTRNGWGEFPNVGIEQPLLLIATHLFPPERI